MVILDFADLSFVVVSAFRLVTAYDSLACQGSLLFGHNCALTIGKSVLLKIDHDPILRPSELVCVGTVGEQCREVPVIQLSMKNWNTGITFGIEPFGRNGGKQTTLCLVSVVAINLE